MTHAALPARPAPVATAVAAQDPVAVSLGTDRLPQAEHGGVGLDRRRELVGP